MDGQRRRDAYPHEEEAMSDWSPPASDLSDSSGPGFVPPEAAALAAKPSWWQKAQTGFPYDKPGTTYGNILPFSKDEKTGEVSFAAPEMIRSPARGMISMGARATGAVDQFSRNTSEDEINALSAFTGAKSGG